MNAVDVKKTPQIATAFQRFADKECAGSSPLYAHLARGVAQDPTLLHLASRSRIGQPVPNLLFAAVQLLLLRNGDAPLAQFYPNLTEHAKPSAQAFPAFRRFCAEHAKDISEMISTRIVQTNEVGRSSYLYPAFSLIAEETKQPLFIIEIGSSAGLNLIFDHYRYTYRRREQAILINEKATGPMINCELRGPATPKIGTHAPKIAGRVGIDLNPLNMDRPDDALWLQALIWPEHNARKVLMVEAFVELSKHKHAVIPGDAVETLETVLQSAPAGCTLAVFHTHTMNQLTEESKVALEDVVRQFSKTRPVFRLANDLGHDLELLVYQAGAVKSSRLASVDFHGAWLEWAA